MKNKILPLVAALVIALLTSGCGSIVYASLHRKLPITSAERLKISVNFVAIGGGSLEVTQVKTDPVTGAVTTGTYLETITTGSGALVIEGNNVRLK